MEVRAESLLCDAATVREGLLHVLGGGINKLTRPAFPARMSLDLALLLTFDEPRAVEGEHLLSVVVRTADSREVGRVEIGFAAREAEALPPDERDRPAVAPLVVPLRDVPLPQPGDYTVVVQLDGHELTHNDFLAKNADDAGP
jgi:hypothetical protein